MLADVSIVYDALGGKGCREVKADDEFRIQNATQELAQEVGAVGLKPRPDWQTRIICIEGIE